MADEKSTMGRLGARCLLISSFLYLVVMNVISNTGVINGSNMKRFIIDYSTRITPASYAFSIWGLVLASIALFVVYFVVKRSAIDSLPWTAIAAFVLHCIVDGVWPSLFAPNLIWVSFVFVLISIGTSAYLYTVFYPGATSAFPQWNLGYWCRGACWSIELGWVSVTSLVNLYIVLNEYKLAVTSAAQDTISILMLLLAGVVGFTLLLRHEDVVSVIVMLWALIGIAVGHSDDDVVLATSLVVGGALLGLVLFAVMRKLLRGKSSEDYLNISSPKYVPGDEHL